MDAAKGADPLQRGVAVRRGVKIYETIYFEFCDFKMSLQAFFGSALCNQRRLDLDVDVGFCADQAVHTETCLN